MAISKRPDFGELIRRGVIDPRMLPGKLAKEVKEDLDRRIDEMRAERERRRDDPLPF